MKKKIYNKIVRPYTSKKISVHNGIPSRQIYLLDSTDTFLNEKTAYLGELAEAAQSGNTVVQIGAGAGISTIAAAELTAPNGEAITFEAGSEQIEMTKETIELNKKHGRKLVQYQLNTHLSVKQSIYIVRLATQRSLNPMNCLIVMY